MKKTINRLEKFRVTQGPMKSSHRDGKNGKFMFPAHMVGRLTIPIAYFNKRSIGTMSIVCSDGEWWDEAELGKQQWEHVSASWPDRTPTWAEMCRVKNLFWDAHEAVVQFHPPESEYVNHHKYCLHLWKPRGVNLPMPPSLCVGPKT